MQQWAGAASSQHKIITTEQTSDQARSLSQDQNVAAGKFE